jgi:xanthine dehydrogenase accessory factor
VPSLLKRAPRRPPTDDGFAGLGVAELRAGGSRVVTLADGDGAASPEPVEVFAEVHGPPRALVVFGGGSVAVPLVRLANVLGLRTTVVDARPRFASRERFPEADDVLLGIPSEIAAALAYTPATLVVLVAHDYKYDVPVLEAVLPSAAGYVGLLGSRRRGAALLELLRERGVPASLLERVHVPVGLDIGAESAAEIALSILAEALAVRAGRPGGFLRDRHRVSTPRAEG